MSQNVKVAVVGASGYSGRELLRLRRESAPARLVEAKGLEGDE